jgi:hypothetical protein
MSDISTFRGKADPDSVAARRIWARQSNPAYKKEDTKTYIPTSQALAEALLLKDELLSRVAGLDAKIEELRDMQSTTHQ